MEREGEVRKPRPPFDPASLALPSSFRFFASLTLPASIKFFLASFALPASFRLFCGCFGQTSFSHSNYQVDPLLRYAGKKKQGNIPGTKSSNSLDLC